VLKQRHQLFVALLSMSDALVASVACMAAWFARQFILAQSLPRGWSAYLKEPLILVVVPTTIIMFWASRLYQARRDQSMLRESISVVRAAILALGASIVVLWATESKTFASARNAPGDGLIPWFESSRLQMGLLLVFLPGILVLYRMAFRFILRIIRQRGLNLRHVVVIGTGRLGQIVFHTLERNAWTGIHVAGFISHHEQTRRTECLGRPVYGGMNDLESLIEKYNPDAVYLAIPNSAGASIPSILRRLEQFVLDVRIVPDVHPRFLPQSMAVAELDGMPILSVRESPLYGLGGASKRALDVCGAIFGLIILSPLMLLIAIAVRLTSPGPVIFKQRRVGLNGDTFKMYKFRTMLPKERWPAEYQSRITGWTERDDPRITTIGRLLRRTSLDELPQFLNVLKGQMSLVGPRPERADLIDEFRQNWRGYMLRQHVKAGMTGWAQINGLRGDTSLRKRLQYDLFYIRHWSIWFDLRILMLTIFKGWIHPNAH
jgi:Undecaprenyl-phosphate glucose phosphotransferase